MTLSDIQALDAQREARREAMRDQLHRSLLLAALENIVKYDDCPVLRAAARARYLDLTDGMEPARNPQ